MASLGHGGCYFLLPCLHRKSNCMTVQLVLPGSTTFADWYHKYVLVTLLALVTNSLVVDEQLSEQLLLLTWGGHLARLVVHVGQVRVLQGLLDGHAAARVELQHPVQQVDARRAGVRELPCPVAGLQQHQQTTSLRFFSYISVTLCERIQLAFRVEHTS